MSEKVQNSETAEQNDRLHGAVRGILATADTALTTADISSLLSLSQETAKRLLRDLANQGIVTACEDNGVVRWRKAGTDIHMTEGENSYQVKDTETAIVSRAGTRPEALRQLANRLEQYGDGETVGAQIRGISETTLSPAYAQGIESLITDYVAPDDKHLYVYIENEGVQEIKTQEHLHREYTIVGFAITGRFTRSEFDDAMPVSVNRLLEEVSIGIEFPLSLFKLMAVHPDYQGQGIATALVTHGMAYLAEYPPVVAMIWEGESDAGVTMAEEHGAQRLAEFENTSPSKWQCPDCGFGTRCTCKSAFYGWGLE